MNDNAPKCIQEKSEGDALLASLKEEVVEVQKPVKPFWSDPDKKWKEYHRKAEQPFHRLIMEGLAQGSSGNEIASQLGISPGTVSSIKRTPLALNTIAEIQADTRGKAFQILDEAAEKAARLLVNTLDDVKVAADKRCKIANELLDRLYGCATTKVEAKTGALEEMTHDQLLAIAQGKEAVKSN